MNLLDPNIGLRLADLANAAATAELMVKEGAAQRAIELFGLEGLTWCVWDDLSLGSRVTRLERDGLELWRCWWDWKGYEMKLRAEWTAPPHLRWVLDGRATP